MTLWRPSFRELMLDWEAEGPIWVWGRVRLRVRVRVRVRLRVRLSD